MGAGASSAVSTSVSDPEDVVDTAGANIEEVEPPELGEVFGMENPNGAAATASPPRSAGSHGSIKVKDAIGSSETITDGERSGITSRQQSKDITRPPSSHSNQNENGVDAYMEINTDPEELIDENLVHSTDEERERDESYSDQQLDSIQEKMLRVQNIMREMDTDDRIVDLNAETRHAREVRVNVAKRLSQLKAIHDRNVEREELNRKKDFLIQKTQKIEKILEKRKQQAQLKKEMELYEAKEMTAIAKLQEYHKLVEEKKVKQEENRAAWEKKFEPVLSIIGGSLDHPNQALKEAARTAGPHVNKDITKELQFLLSKTFHKSSSEIYRQRAELNQYRYDIQQRLDELRSAYPNILKRSSNSSIKSVLSAIHGPGNNITEDFLLLEQKVLGNILDLRDLIGKYKLEADWLQVAPSTRAWRDLETTLSSVTRRNELQEKVDNAKVFVASLAEQTMYKAIDDYVLQYDSQVKRVSKDLMFEAVSSLIHGLCEHVVTLTEEADTACRRMIANTISNYCYSSHPPMMRLLQGNLHATALSTWHSNVNKESTIPQGPRLVCTEKNPALAIKRDINMRLRCNKEISLKKTIMGTMDGIANDRLSNAEAAALRDLCVVSVPGKVSLPTSAGKLCLIRVLPRLAACQSLLVAGTDLGRFVVWAVPWSTAEGALVPTLSGYSPSLPLSEVSPVDELKESPTSPNLIITLDKKGVVRVWSLNPLAKKGRHSRNAFSNNVDAFVPFVPACLFLLNPSELNLPAPPPACRAYTKLKASQPEPGVHVQTICFHPSCNFAGRNQSFMVGTNGGDLYKINMDFKEPALVSPVMFLKPFVDLEFPHPIFGEMHAFGNANNSGANRVYREIFHFHKSPIVFLDVVHRASEFLLSIDTSGVMAKWRYVPKFFSGNSWFVPETTAFLDLAFLSHEPLALDCNDGSGSFISNYTEKIECPPQYLLDRLRLWRRRQLRAPPADSHVTVETFFPIVESEDLELLYERVTMVNDASASSLDNGLEADEEQDSSPRNRYSNLSDNNSRDVMWIRQKIKRCLSGSVIHNICMSEDGADLGILLSCKVFPKHSVYVAALEKQLQGDLVKDDFEIALKLVGVIVTVDSSDLVLHPCYTIFDLDAYEKVVSLTLGPLEPSIGTRLAAVKTTTRLRIFSTDTGVEIFPLSGNFPFSYPSTPAPSRQQKFPRSVSAVCPHFSIMAFGNNASSEITLYRLCHNAKASPPHQKFELSEAEKKHLKHRLRHLVLKHPETSFRLCVSKDVANDIITFLIDNAVGVVVEMEKKARVMVEMYGSSTELGVIHPTEWPIIETQQSNNSRDNSSHIKMIGSPTTQTQNSIIEGGISGIDIDNEIEAPAEPL